ncbi:hypothetical protein L3Y34_005324 [Caenorhabditis briggsae]|uniref:SCP domain-containing protein n=2 Tax=Caenorhabditis briggsae TaxID=6238 RepID=A0AAE9AJA3_CAEBR|nr:hypothetical protein L3Y34_005324 [Caenorhabditis briggsae]
MKLIICILVIFGCASAQLKNITAEAILKYHNDFRSSIAKGTYSTIKGLLPAASNMRKMKWDQGLATTIQDFLNGCPITKFPTHFGQNGYTKLPMLSNISDAEALDAAKSWEIELFYFGLSSIQFNKATLTKTATQMAWADTEFIGVVRRSVKALVGRVCSSFE